MCRFRTLNSVPAQDCKRILLITVGFTDVLEKDLQEKITYPNDFE